MTGRAIDAMSESKENLAEARAKNPNAETAGQRIGKNLRRNIENAKKRARAKNVSDGKTDL